MKRLSLILLVVITSACSAVSQNVKFKPSFSASLDTSEGPALLNQCSRSIPANISGFWKVSSADVDSLEANFRNIYTIESGGCFGNGSQVTDLKAFGFQYIGLIIKGRRFIYINAFPYSEIENAKQYGFSFDPAKRAMVVCDGGNDFWGVLFNMKTKRFSSLSCNGFA